MKHKFILIVSLSGLLLSGLIACSEDFEQFTDVTKLRVMAIQSSPAELLPGDTGQITALVSAPKNKEISYQWTWCPIATNAFNAHVCPIDEKMLMDMISQNIDLPIALPTGVSIFDLGTDATAEFPYVFGQDTLKLICEQIAEQFGDNLPFIPECEGRLATTIRLDVSDGEQTLTAVKQLNLLLDSKIVVNQNPPIGELQIVNSNIPSVLNADGILVVGSKDKLELKVMAAPSVSETFQTTSIVTNEVIQDNESLFMTWFITSGETEFGRTSYIPSETNFEKLLLNTWWLPSVAESSGNATIHVVLQDERGGVSWTSRTLAVEERLK